MSTVVDNNMTVVADCLMAEKLPSDVLLDELDKWCRVERGRALRLAEALGVSRQRVSQWCQKLKRPNFDAGMRLYAFLVDQGSKLDLLQYARSLPQRKPKPGRVKVTPSSGKPTSYRRAGRSAAGVFRPAKGHNQEN
jgi:hypothetical protein